MLLKNMIIIKKEDNNIFYQDPFFKQRDFKGIIPIMGWLGSMNIFNKLSEINKPYDVKEFLESIKNDYNDNFTLCQIQRVIDYCNLI